MLPSLLFTKGHKKKKKGKKTVPPSRPVLPAGPNLCGSIRPSTHPFKSVTVCIMSRWKMATARTVCTVSVHTVCEAQGHPPARPPGRPEGGREGGIDRREARRRRLYLRWTQKLEVRIEVFKRKCPNVSSLLAWCQT